MSDLPPGAPRSLTRALHFGIRGGCDCVPHGAGEETEAQEGAGVRRPFPSTARVPRGAGPPHVHVFAAIPLGCAGLTSPSSQRVDWGLRRGHASPTWRSKQAGPGGAHVSPRSGHTRP